MRKSFKYFLFSIAICSSIFFAMTMPSNGIAKDIAGDLKGNLVVDNSIKIKYNDSFLALKDSNVLMYNDRILLPTRLVFERFGANVDWDEATKTVTAIKGEKQVVLTIGNKKVIENGKEVILDIAPMTYKNRSYMPLRFIGEAFGAEVNWNGKENQVEIRLNENIDLASLKINLNNNEIKFKYKPVKINDIIYLPFIQFLEEADKSLSVDNNFSWHKDANNNFFITFDGLNIRTVFDNPVIYINQIPVKSNDYPILHNGLIYMPLGFVKNVLNSNVFWDGKTESLQIYMNRSKFKTKFLEKTTMEIVKPINAPEPVLTGDRILTISDNPEILTPELVGGPNAVLCESPVISLDKLGNHRVYGWHINKLGKDAKVGIIIINQGNEPIKIKNAFDFYRTSPNQWGNYDIGLPIAEAFLGNFTNKTLKQEVTLGAGSSLLLESFSLPKDNLLGFCNDFTIEDLSKDNNGKYQVKVVVSTDKEPNLKAIWGSAVNVDRKNTHPRGSWKGTTLENTLPTYFAGESEISYHISNGVNDRVYDVENALDGHNEVIANPGHFGANYKLNVPLENNTDREQVVMIRLAPRGGLYNGAVRTPNGDFLVPSLEVGKDGVILYEAKLKPGAKTNVKLEFIHAGGSSLAIAIDLRTK